MNGLGGCLTKEDYCPLWGIIVWSIVVSELQHLEESYAFPVPHSPDIHSYYSLFGEMEP